MESDLIELFNDIHSIPILINVLSIVMYWQDIDQNWNRMYFIK